MVTVKDLKAGQELFCHYMIDMEGAADDIRYHPYTGCLILKRKILNGSEG